MWTTSGVSAGTDGMIGWMTKIYGKDAMIVVTNGMEWNVMADPSNDPFSKLNKCHDKPNQSGLPALR